jgi:hypothetical protein
MAPRAAPEKCVSEFLHSRRGVGVIRAGDPETPSASLPSVLKAFRNVGEACGLSSPRPLATTSSSQRSKRCCV